MMPTKTSVGPNEVVRLEVLRLAPPLLSRPAPAPPGARRRAPLATAPRPTAVGQERDAAGERAEERHAAVLARSGGARGREHVRCGLQAPGKRSSCRPLLLGESRAGGPTVTITFRHE